MSEEYKHCPCDTCPLDCGWADKMTCCKHCRWAGDGQQDCAECGYEQDLALSEAGKRLMRLTKAEMISTIGQCMGMLLAYYDIRQQYDYLQATMDIFRDESTAVMDAARRINDVYREAEREGFESDGKYTRELSKIAAALPNRVWIEY